MKVAAKVGLPLLVAAFAFPAFGEIVDFTTTGTFGCGITSVGCSTSNGGSTLTVINGGNTLNITADGFTNNGILAADPTVDDVNVITFNTTSTNSPTGGGVNTAGVTFTLNINQTLPAGSPNQGNLGGSFSGTIDAKGSNTIVTMNQTVLILSGPVIYTLDFLNLGENTWTIPNPGINKTGVTTETATVTPEPTFMMLTGLGFAGLAFVAYRRKRTA